MGTSGMERNLSIVSGNEAGTIFAASSAYGELVGRPLDAIVGHCLEDWYHPDDIVRMRELRTEAIHGAPLSSVRKIVRNGLVSFVTLNLMSVTMNRSDLLLGTIAPLELEGDIEQKISVSEYIEDLAKGLAAVAATAGLSELRCQLDDVSLEAAALSNYLAGKATRLQLDKE